MPHRARGYVLYGNHNSAPSRVPQMYSITHIRQGAQTKPANLYFRLATTALWQLLARMTPAAESKEEEDGAC
eukprot:scaffold360747_cov24-Prasinocladus_malaysianus.AAC.1